MSIFLKLKVAKLFKNIKSNKNKRKTIAKEQ